MNVPPIHAMKMDGAIGTETGQLREDASEELGELGFRHLAGGHYELLVLDLAGAADMTVHCNVIGRVSEHHLGFLALEELLVALSLKRIGAEHPVAAELPEVTDPGDRGDNLVRADGELFL